MEKTMLKRTCLYFLIGGFVCSVFLIFGSLTYAATYNSSKGELSLPVVFDGNKTYTDVILRLNPDGTYSFIQGTEMTVPFRCTNNFDGSMLGLISDQMTVQDINSLLGCNWSMTFINSFSGGDTGVAYSWFDKQCTGIDISYDSSGTIYSKSIGYTSECKLVPNNGLIYDLTAERFIIQDVVIDDMFIAPFTILKFDVQNKTWALISAELVDRGQPPFLCNLFTENTFTKLQSVNTVSEVENLLGCQWSENNNDDSWTFRDHECGMVTFSQSRGFSSKILLHKRTGCGT